MNDNPSMRIDCNTDYCRVRHCLPILKRRLFYLFNISDKEDHVVEDSEGMNSKTLPCVDSEESSSTTITMGYHSVMPSWLTTRDQDASKWREKRKER